MSDRKLFLGLLAACAAFHLYISAMWMIPAGHDGLLYMIMQYAQVNCVVSGDWVAKWLPYTRWGTSGQFMLTGFSSPAMQVIDLLLYCFSKIQTFSINYIRIYHIDMFMFDLTALVGTWLLSRKLYDSPLTAVFVSSAAVFTSILLEQTTFSYTAFFAIPLVLYLMLEWMDKENGTYGFLAALVALYSSINVTAYVAIIQLLVYFIFWATYFILNPEALKTVGRLLWPTPKRIVALLVIAICTAALVYCSMHGFTPGQVISQSRQVDGKVSLEVFNTYPGYVGRKLYGDIFRGHNNYTPDLSNYRGFMVVFLSVFAVLKPRRQMIPFLAVIAILFLFSQGRKYGVSTFLWYCFPGMRYYRHIGFVVPMVTFFMCFVAGFGFESLVSERKYKLFKFVVLVGIVPIYVMLVGSFISKWFFPGYASPYRAMLSIIIFTSLLLLIFRLKENTEHSKTILALILLVHLADVSIYRLYIYNNRPYQVSALERTLWDTGPMPYQAQRGGEVYDSKRGRIFYRMVMNHQNPPNFNLVYYGTVSTLLQHDPAFDAQRQLQIEGNSAEYESLYTCRENEGYYSVAGIHAPKIQFFSSVYAADDAATRDNIVHPSYKGGLLSVALPESARASTPGLEAEWDPVKDRRVSVPYAVTGYSANAISVSLDSPLKTPAWLFYSDSWDAHWTATVDGRETPVLRANLAFKTVWLPAGARHVAFRYVDKWLDFATLITRLGSLLFVAWLLRATWLLARGRWGVGRTVS